VDTAFGMDGALYVSDFASRIIGHAQHPMRDPQWNHTRGRIWRVVSKERPVVTDWPQIEGAGVPELLALLKHPQDLVREHARIELRRKGAEAVAAVDAWVAGMKVSDAAGEQAVLEALWVLHAQGQTRPEWLARLMKSPDARMRAAVVMWVRFQADRLAGVPQFLSEAARDAHPRVRAAVVHVVSHLRAMGVVPQGEDNKSGRLVAHGEHGAASLGNALRGGAGFAWEKVLEGMNTSEAVVQKMVADLKVGLKPAKGRSVPVLRVEPESTVRHWQNVSGESHANAAKGAPAGATRNIRTFVRASEAQTVLLSVKHGHIDVSANGVQLLSSDNSYSAQQQVQLDLTPGLNLIELNLRKVSPKIGMPPVFLCNTLGQALTEAHLPADESELRAFAEQWDKAHADEQSALRVQAVPNLLQFAPREFRVKAGQPVRILFENPDLMQHNWVLVAPGAEEEVGVLADQMAAKPDGLAKNFVPDSPKVLQATALVNPAGRAELKFTSPAKAGVYPFLCTFPGHWRVMKGELIVE
jgi:azurin